VPLAHAPARLTRFVAVLAVALWGTYFVAAPTVGFGLGDSWHNEHRLLQVGALGVTALLLAALAMAPGARARIPGVALSLRLLLLLAVVSALMAQYPVHAFGEIALMVSLAGLALLTATLVRLFPDQAAGVVRTGVLLVAFTQVFGVAARYASALALGAPIDQAVAILGYSNPRFPSALYVLLMPFLVAMAIDAGQSSAKVRRLAWGLLVALWCINFALGTRAMFVALVAGVVALALLGQGAAARRGGLALLGTMLAGGALFYVLWLWLPGLLQTGGALPGRLDELASPNGRELLLSSSWTAIRAHPWLGLGPMHFAAIERVWAAHPHNAALQIAVEVGLPALALAAWAGFKLVATGRRALRDSQPERAWLTQATLLAVLAGGALAMLDGVHVMPVSQSLLAILIGLSIGLVQQSQEAIAAASAERERAIKVFAIFIAATFLLGYAVLTYEDQPAQEAAYKASFGQGRFFVPRFWQQGLLLTTP
jgi:O-antigen ligase